MMTITYTVEDGLYVNMTNRCTNRCDFCIRNNGASAYGSESLWLEREPTVEEIKEALANADPMAYREVVFCGYGEPTMRLFDMLLVCKWLKSRYPEIPIRINTNGQASLITGYDVAPFFEGCFDVVSVSLNSPTAIGYDRICHSIYGEDTLNAVIDFTAKVKNYVPETMMSVVRETLSESELAECRAICDRIGVKLKVRTYIGPDDTPAT